MIMSHDELLRRAHRLAQQLLFVRIDVMVGEGGCEHVYTVDDHRQVGRPGDVLSDAGLHREHTQEERHGRREQRDELERIHDAHFEREIARLDNGSQKED